MQTLKTYIHKISYYSPIFFYLLIAQKTFAQIRSWDDPNGDGVKTDSCLVNGVPTLKCLEVVIANLLMISNALILLALFVMFTVGSFKWLTSLGNPDKIESARGTFKWAIIGLIVYVSAYLILRIIDILFLGGQGTIFTFSIG